MSKVYLWKDKDKKEIQEAVLAVLEPKMPGAGWVRKDQRHVIIIIDDACIAISPRALFKTPALLIEERVEDAQQNIRISKMNLGQSLAAVDCHENDVVHHTKILLKYIDMLKEYKK